MSYLERKIILILTLFTLSCGTDSEPENMFGTWNELGLTSDNITALDFNNDTIFLASETQLYKKNINSSSDEWTNIGFQFNTEISVFGDILYTNNGLFAVVRNFVDYEKVPENYVSLYKSTDEGESWDSIQIDLEGRTKPHVLMRIEGNESNENVLYGDSHIIYGSNDETSWEDLSGSTKVGISEFLYVSKDHPNQIWTGGWNNVFAPYLAKSDDGGETWATLNQNIYFNTDANVYAVVVHPEKEQMVLAGLGGTVASANVIRKSIDGGDTWETKLEGFNTRILENSKLQENRVYATGRNQNGTLFFTVTDNFGDTWETVEFEEGPTQVRVNDMVSILEKGKEVLYFGTNKGLYSYTLSN